MEIFKKFMNILAVVNQAFKYTTRKRFTSIINKKMKLTVGLIVAAFFAVTVHGTKINIKNAT